MSDVRLRIGQVRLQGADASIRNVREPEVRTALSAAIGSAVRARVVELGDDARSGTIEGIRVRLTRPVAGGPKGVADFAETVAGAVRRSL
jgi:hypothetical protein